MGNGVFVSALGAMDSSGRLTKGNDIPFSVDDVGRVNVDRTRMLHRAAAKYHQRKLANMGIRVKPYTDEEIDKRTESACGRWQTRDTDEAQPGGSYLHESSAELCAVREIDPVEVRKAETHLYDTRRAMLKPWQVRAIEARGLDGGTDTALVGIDYLHDFYRELRLAGKIAPLIPAIDIPAGYASHTYPVLGDMQFTLEGALTSNAFSVNTAVNPTSSSVNLAPKKFQGVIFVSGELTEDTLAPIIPALQQSGVRGANVALEHVILSGDTVTTAGSNINASGGTLALGSKDPRLGFDGFRGLVYKGTYAGSAASAMGGVNGSNATATLNNILTLIASIGKYADAPENLILVLPVQLEKDLQQDAKARPDTYSSLISATKGKLETVGGAQVVTVGNSVITHASTSNVPTYSLFLSEGLPTNLNASGVWDNTTTTRKTCVLFNRQNFVLGWKRQLQWKVVDLPLGDQFAVTMSFRVTMAPKISNEGAAVGFNFA